MYDKTKLKVLGKFKSEETLKQLTSAVWSLNVKPDRLEEFEEHKKAKGVMRNKLKNDTHFEKYERILEWKQKRNNYIQCH